MRLLLTLDKAKKQESFLICVKIYLKTGINIVGNILDTTKYVGPATDEVYGLAVRLLEWEEKVKPFS